MTTVSKVQSAIFQREIETLVREGAGIRSAVVATIDGFDVVSASARGIDLGSGGGRLAAMSSSMLALAEAMAKEAALSLCNDVIVDCADGRLLLLSIQLYDERFVLCASAGHEATLGHVLFAARNCAREITRRLQA